MNKSMRRFFSKAVRVFYPKRCVSCGKIIPLIRDYCECSKDTYTTVSDDFCPHCARDIENCCCNREQAVKLRHVTAPFLYSGLTRTRLLEFKLASAKSESEFFSQKMAQRFAVSFPLADIDAVTFVPMTKAAVRKRGYNQSELLAKGISKQLFVPFVKALEKTAETKNQHTLSQSERLSNLNGVFQVIDETKVAGKTFILCDDIKTTGTTLFRCEQALLFAGAKDVYCLCAAISDFGYDLTF